MDTIPSTRIVRLPFENMTTPQNELISIPPLSQGPVQPPSNALKSLSLETVVLKHYLYRKEDQFINYYTSKFTVSSCKGK